MLDDLFPFFLSSVCTTNIRLENLERKSWCPQFFKQNQRFLNSPTACLTSGASKNRDWPGKNGVIYKISRTP
jgi:hypothetical protein